MACKAGSYSDTSSKHFDQELKFFITTEVITIMALLVVCSLKCSSAVWIVNLLSHEYKWRHYQVPVVADAQQSKGSYTLFHLLGAGISRILNAPCTAVSSLFAGYEHGLSLVKGLSQSYHGIVSGCLTTEATVPSSDASIWNYPACANNSRAVLLATSLDNLRILPWNDSPFKSCKIQPWIAVCVFFPSWKQFLLMLAWC